MGRPAHNPDPVQRRQVEAMAAYGVPETEISRTLGVDAKTLRKHYRDELDLGHVKANTKVAEALYHKATTDGPQSVTAAIFWLKARAGWREASSMEVSGAARSPTLQASGAASSKGPPQGTPLEQRGDRRFVASSGGAGDHHG